MSGKAKTPTKPIKKGENWQETLIKNGYAARTIPKEYGGFGAEPDVLKSRIIAEEFTEAQIPLGMANQGISMLVPTLLELGSEDQKKSCTRPVGLLGTSRAGLGCVPNRNWRRGQRLSAAEEEVFRAIPELATELEQPA